MDSIFLYCRSVPGELSTTMPGRWELVSADCQVCQDDPDQQLAQVGLARMGAGLRWLPSVCQDDPDQQLAQVELAMTTFGLEKEHGWHV